MPSKVVIAAQFRGPPNSGNGGYVCGLMAKRLEGPATVFLRAPPPLDTPLDLLEDAEGVRLMSADGLLIGEARRATEALPDPPQAPSWSAVEAAGLRFPGLERRFHPICFTCGDRLDPGVGLRVFAGQVEGEEIGHVAAPFRLHPAFADKDGLAPEEIVWAALDCPGSVAWVEGEGAGGLLGSMTGEVLRRPAAEEPVKVLAWRIEKSGRKRLSGTAMISQDGEVMARSRQIWIVRA